MATYEFSTKLNNRKNSQGVIVEKVRVWIEESTNNRFLSDNGFTRGTPVDIHIQEDSILIENSEEHLANRFSGSVSWDTARGKQAKVAGKADRALFDITRNADQMPESFHPKNNSRLVATIEYGLITIKVKGE